MKNMCVAYSPNGWITVVNTINSSFLSAGERDIVVLFLDCATSHYISHSGDHLFSFINIDNDTYSQILLKAINSQLNIDDWISVSVSDTGEEQVLGFYKNNSFKINVIHNIEMDTYKCQSISGSEISIKENIPTIPAPPVIINDHVCIFCGNMACSKDEHSCWKCGNLI